MSPEKERGNTTSEQSIDKSNLSNQLYQQFMVSSDYQYQNIHGTRESVINAAVWFGFKANSNK